MHDFQRRVHHQVFNRQAADDPDAVGPAKRPPKQTDTATKAPPVTKPTTAAPATSAAPTAKTPPAATPVTTPTVPTPIIDISSVVGVTSVLPKVPTLTTSSSTTTTSSSTSSSSSTKPATTSTPARNLVTETATLTSSGTAASSTSSDKPTTSGGLSGAATGGIIAGCVLAGLALLIFVVRKTFIRRRQRKRNTWGAGIYPDINEKFSDGASIRDVPPPIPEKLTTSPTYLQPRTPVWAPPRPVSPSAPSPGPYYVQPPQASYNNPMMEAAPSVAPVAAAAGMAGAGAGAVSSFGGHTTSGETAIVRVLYIPTLPDELSVTTGEVIQIVKAYDDGWALCANARGEQGVVPLECLDRSSQGQGDRLSVGYGQQGNGNDWRNMKRISSLSTEQPRY